MKPEPRLAERRTPHEAAELEARIVAAYRRDPRTPNAIARELGCSHVTARRVMRQLGLDVPKDGVERGHVAAAMAERAAGKPLVVESLEQRLARLVPGAVLHDSQFEGTEDRWRATRGRRLLATGASAREAVDRAVWLWGRR